MDIEERFGQVEKRVDRVEKRDNLIEQAILQMKDLVISHEERLDDFSKSIRESREDFNFKLNALIDLQLENEVGIRELKASSVKEWEAIKELRQSSTELRRASEKLRRASEELRQASQSQLTRIEKLEGK